MTAYVNDEQKKEGAYGKAVKATLAATLAAGMVPAAAFAEEPAEAAEGNDVELLALSAKDAWENGVFTFEDNNGNAIELKKKRSAITRPSSLPATARTSMLCPSPSIPKATAPTPRT